MRFPGMKHFPSTLSPGTHMYARAGAKVLSFLHLAVLCGRACPTHVCTRRMFIWPRKRGFSPQTCQSEMGIFQVCNYTLWVQADKITRLAPPETPISHSQHNPSQREIRQNHLDRSGTNTSKPFVCHTWGPQMDSHHIVDWKFMLIYTSTLFLFPNITFILPAVKCSGTCPYCPPATNLSVSSWRRGPEAMFPCHLSHVVLWHCFWKSACSTCIFYRKPLSFLKQWIIHLLLYYCKRFVTLETECNMQFITVHGDAQRLCKSVSVSLGERRGQERKQAPVTPDSPSASRGNYSFIWGLRCTGWWWPRCLSTQLYRQRIIFNMPLCPPMLFGSTHWLQFDLAFVHFEHQWPKFPL